ncbi:MAG: Crp/Fnr family transcriptional regulator [Gammaproteobacteria bacterium]|nr:Crp/Fnr family transcriptional regulator [Gammaproteobacteria bacterium]
MGENPEQRLATIFRGLSNSKRAGLLDFAEFLYSRENGERKDTVAKEPLPISRPGEETVVKAIQRLTVTYPMIDATDLMNESTTLVTQHVMEGRSAKEVIDDLEALFQSHHERLTGDK